MYRRALRNIGSAVDFTEGFGDAAGAVGNDVGGALELEALAGEAMMGDAKRDAVSWLKAQGEAIVS